MNQHRANLLSIYQAGVKAAHGRHCVSDWLRRHPQSGTCYIVAIGKAAAAMAAGALEALNDQVGSVLVITRHGYADQALIQDRRVQQVEAGHPVPDQASLDAGQTLLDFIASTPSSTSLLFLLSGGASALVEVLPKGMTLADLQRVNHWLLASGLPIQAMNAVRIALSGIKGGRLSAYVHDHPALVLLISDVPDDDPAIIGSGLLYPSSLGDEDALRSVPVWLERLLDKVQAGHRLAPNTSPPAATISHYIVANAESAQHAAVKQAQQLGYHVYTHQQRVYGDINRVAEQLAAVMATDKPGLHVWSGETTVILPDKPGNGGRCQSLALAFALSQERIKGQQRAGNDIDQSCPWLFLAAGSDGSDGTGAAAGALVDNTTRGRILAAGLDPQRCLIQADAGRCLEASNDLIMTGPTGANIMDIMLGLRLV